MLSARDFWDFVQRINGTTAAPPLNTFKGCVNTAIVMSLCAFFDKEAAAVNLMRILNDLRLNQKRR